MNNWSKISLLTLIINCLFCSLNTEAQIILKNDSKPSYIGKHIYYLEDKTNNLSLNDIIHRKFKASDQAVPSFGLRKSTYWIKFTITNQTDNNSIILILNNPTISNVYLYTFDHQKILSEHSGERVPISKREIKNQNPTFSLHIRQKKSKTYFLKIRSEKVLSIPLMVGSIQSIAEEIDKSHYIFGMYTGLMLIMLLYNLFIFFTTKDEDYLYYIFYIGAIFITQAGLQGYTFKYLWPNNTWIAAQSTNIFIALSGIVSIIFVNKFLSVKRYFKNIYNIFIIILFIYFICIIINLLGYLIISQRIQQVNAVIGSLLIIICGILIQQKGNRAAIFFNIAWLSFLIGVIVYILKDIEVIPYNIYSHNALLIGSSLEVTLLSLALADKINTYKAEKEKAQVEALQASREKEEYVRQENIVLEAKVAERTSKLEAINTELTTAITNLKTAESQLIHAEKMASIGQLTAGIAHEINNPINFVKSNVNSLKLDFEDLIALIKSYQEVSLENWEVKQNEIKTFIEAIDLETVKNEIADLLSGIKEGAVRTADIVQGLRTFSRLDEDALKKADIHSGIDATLRMTHNIMPDNLLIIKEYGDIPEIECYPGKLNQVFMNILTNGIQAIASISENQKNETITITTKIENDNVIIQFTDTGPGIPEEAMKHIFDPFFTTKEVGEGTGLGLSIAYSIIQDHGGTIKVRSEKEKGTKFTIYLPLKLGGIEPAGEQESN